MHFRQVFVGLLALVCLSPDAAAQRPSGPRPRPPMGRSIPTEIEESFYLGGRILFADRMQPAPRILVTLLGSGGQRVGVTYTDNRGEFEFVGLPRGVYQVDVTEEGYEPARERVDLYLGSRRDTTFFLKARGPDTALPPGRLLSVRELKIPPKAQKAFDKGLEQLHDKKKPEESFAHFRKAIEIYPDFDEAYVQWSLAHIQRGEYGQAEEVLKQATAVNPNNARAYMVLGSLHNDQGRPEDAVTVLQHALELEANAWQVHFELGRAFLQLGQAEKGYQHARRAHELNAGLPGVHLLVYNLCLPQGDYQTALAELNEFLELFPNSPLAEKVRQQRDLLREHLNQNASAKP